MFIRMSTIRIENLNRIHQTTYDALAEEYEQRAETYALKTNELIHWFATYLPKGRRVLDIACGVGVTTRALITEGCDVTGIDISPNMIRYAKMRGPGAHYVIGDFASSGFRDEFDGIIAFAYVHLFPVDTAVNVLTNMRRALRPGGVAYVGTTVSDVSSEGWEGKSDYPGSPQRFRKHWTEQEFRSALMHVGFEIAGFQTHIDAFGKEWMDFIARRPISDGV